MSEIPPWLTTMRSISGIIEAPGAEDNPKILAMAAEIGQRYPEMAAYCRSYTHDSIPWCGLAVAYCLAMNDIRPQFGPTDTERFLWAKSWLRFGNSIEEPQVGAIMVFTREGGGHVSLFEREEGDYYIVRGGNQSNAINETKMSKSSCIGMVWPKQRTIVVVPPMGEVKPTDKTDWQTGITATVFSSNEFGAKGAYGDWLDPSQVYLSLPATLPRGTLVEVRGPKGSVVGPVLSKGPWYINDPYWISGTRPKAENGQPDSRGRIPNGAGIDLSPALAEMIGIHGKGKVDWRFATEHEEEPTVAQPEPEATPWQDMLALMQRAGNLSNVMASIVQIKKLKNRIDIDNVTAEEFLSAVVVAMKYLTDGSAPATGRAPEPLQLPAPPKGNNMPVSTTQIMVFVRWLLTFGPIAALLTKKSIDPNAAISVIEWILGVGIPFLSQVWAQYRATPGETTKKAAAIPGVEMKISPTAPASVQAVAKDDTIPNVNMK